MWSEDISDEILDYYSTHYSARERRYYELDVSNCVIGGDRGMKLLLGDKPHPTDNYELYTDNIIQESRNIADKFFSITCHPLVKVSTAIPMREIKIELSSRLLAVLYYDSTANKTKRVVKNQEIISNLPSTYSLEIVKKKDDDDETALKEYNVLAPHLVILRYLRKINNPFDQDDKEKNRNYIKRLLDITDEKFINGKYSTIESEIDKIPKYLLKILKNRVFISFRHNILMITGLEHIEDEKVKLIKEIKVDEPRIFDIRIFDDMFGYKIMCKLGDIKIIISNFAYYNVLPIGYHNEIRYVLPSLRARLLMIEDCISHSLFLNGKIQNMNILTSKEDIELALVEEYPKVSKKDNLEELFNEFFYGVHRNLNTMKKILIKQSQKIGPYYPYVQSQRKGKTCLEERIKNKNFDMKLITISE